MGCVLQIAYQPKVERCSAAFQSIDSGIRIKSTQRFQFVVSICSQDEEDQKRDPEGHPKHSLSWMRP